MTPWIFIAIAQADPTWAGMKGANWTPLSTREHDAAGSVETFSATIAGTECFRSMANADVSPEALLDVVADVVASPKWSSAGLSDARVFSKSAKTIDYYQYLDVPGWTLASDRYWFMRAEITVDADATVFFWTRLPEGSPHQAQVDAIRAQNEDAIEPPVNSGAWRFTKANGTTRVEYMVCTNAGGSIPQSVQSMGTKQTLPDTVGDVVKEARKRRS